MQDGSETPDGLGNASLTLGSDNCKTAANSSQPVRARGPDQHPTGMVGGLAQAKGPALSGRVSVYPHDRHELQALVADRPLRKANSQPTNFEKRVLNFPGGTPILVRLVSRGQCFLTFRLVMNRDGGREVLWWTLSLLARR